MQAKPRLIIIEGARMGETFPLRAGLSIGRGPANTIDLPDLKASQHHCRLEIENGEAIVVDLGSRNGTYINETQVERAVLKAGDRIRIGSTYLIYVTGAHPAVLPPADPACATNTIEISPTESQYLTTGLSPQAAATPRVAHDFHVLLRLSEEINAIRKSEALQNRLLERIFEIIPAERGLIALADDKQARFASKVVREKNPGSEAAAPSETIMHNVLERGMAILSSEAPNPRPGQACGVLCVPLATFANRFGVIYADTRDLTAPFDKRHLELLTAIANIGAIALEHVRYVEWLEGENRRLDNEVKSHFGMIGDSPKMRDIKRIISHAARAGSTVIITGESGTGKELVAGAIHQSGPRAKSRFVPVNCGAIPKDLVESELFGHVKGAFSGADRDRKGHFEEANGGTIFLDEIADLPLEAQVKLLRVLSLQEVVRLGTSEPIKLDVQVISATNRALENLVETKQFREDLYYRLSVLSIKLPPLRERKEDIVALAGHFFQKLKHKAGRELFGMHPDFLKALTAHAWPGNIRELENAIEHAIVTGERERLIPEDLPENISGRPPASASGLPRRYYVALEDAAKEVILDAFTASLTGSYTETAEALGLHENLVHRKVTELGIRSQVDHIRHSKRISRRQ